MPPGTVTEIGWTVKTGSEPAAGETSTVNENTLEIPVPTNVEPEPPISPASAKPWRVKV